MTKHLTVSILAVPDTFISCLSGIFDTLTEARDAVSRDLVLEPEIVATSRRVEIGKTRMPLDAHRTLDEIDRTDIVIVPASVVDGARWTTERYGEVVRWLRLMHERGAILCSACSGVLLLAETGLLDGEDATTHWALERYFRETFPKVRLRLERELVVSGADGRLVMSGASTAWHDLTLYLIARFNGPATARAVAKYFMLQWHTEGQAPFFSFEEKTDHGDSAVLAAQQWLHDGWREQAPVDGMIRSSGLSERNFKRRFRHATGYSPIAYVQGLRIERAKQRLEATADPIERISWDVGYEDASFFRRLFKRTVGMRPADYRRRFDSSHLRRLE